MREPTKNPEGRPSADPLLDQALAHNEDGRALLMTVRDTAKNLYRAAVVALEHNGSTQRMMEIRYAKGKTGRPRRDPPEAMAA